MKTRFTRASVSFLTLALSTSLLSAQDEAATPSSAEKDGSYAFGARFASQFKEGEVIADSFVEGFRDQLEKGELRLSEEALEQAFNAWQQSIQEKRASEGAREAVDNLAAAEAFLKENATKEGVKTTDSGLQYLVLEEGEGQSPSSSDKVRVHYHGTFADGQVFDSSTERGEPIETPVEGVIPGWQEGLQLMKEGSKYRFFIHPQLAYGERANPRIPANSLLVFDVEMLDVLAPEKPQAVTPPVAIPPLPKKN